MRGVFLIPGVNLQDEASDQKIRFSDADHPSWTTTHGWYPIVVEQTIRNIKVTRVRIDGGSSINLLFMMGIPRSELIPSK